MWKKNILSDAREDYQMYLKDNEDGQKITQLEKFNVKNNFADWDYSVTETLSRKMGAYQAPMEYLIRETQPAGFVPRNPKEELRYALLLQGRKYDKDNSPLFSMLAVATLNTPAWTYVNSYKNTLNGRAPMTALRDHYDGDASNNKKLVKYKNIIMHSEYHSERTVTWETTSNNLIRAYQWLELRKGQTYTDDIKVMKLASMIKVGNNIALAIVEFMKNTYCSDFAQALTYITSHINELNANSKSSAATRQISSAQRQKKCNGVDISDPFRNFTSDEWHQLQQQGQDFVQQYRIDIQNNGRGRGGRGRQGRGRGGRGYYNNNNGGRGHGGYGYGGRGGGRGGRYGRGSSPKNVIFSNGPKIISEWSNLQYLVWIWYPENLVQ